MTRYGHPLLLAGFLLLTALAAAPGSGAEPEKKPAADQPKKLGASIDGYRWEFPCKEALPENPKKGENCSSALVKGDPKKTDNFTAEREFEGDKGKRYAVTLRFRGVVEPMMYKNGKQDGDYFYIGGEPNNGTYNIYKLTVSSPASHYYLNRQDKVGHVTFKIDYTKTIEIDAGAKLTFHGDGQNGLMISNYDKLVVPDVAPAPKPFNGQFVQVSVVKVEEVKK
ncbi:MAG: hypothetical protein ACKODX_00270 [Gemmata sp.]